MSYAGATHFLWDDENLRSVAIACDRVAHAGEWSPNQAAE